MNKKFKNKKLIYLMLPIISSLIILPTSHLMFLPNSLNETTSLNTKNSKIEPAPKPVKDILDVDTTFSLNQNGSLNITPQEFLQQNPSPNDLSKLIQPYFWEVILNPITGLYEPLSPNPAIVTVIDSTFVNKLGVVSFNFTISPTLVDGVKVDNPKPFSASLSGFKKIESQTSAIVSNGFPFFPVSKPTLINNNELLKTAITLTNPSPNSIYKVEPINNPALPLNKLDVTVTVTNLFIPKENDFIFSAAPKEFIVSLSGLVSFKNSNAFVVNNINANLPASDVLDSDLNIYCSIIDLPPNTKVSYLNKGYDNSKGQLSIDVIFDKYYENDKIILKEKKIVLRVANFKKITLPSEFTQKTIKDILPSNINEDNIWNFVDDETFPDDATYTGMVFEPKDFDGSLKITNIIASKAYDNDGSKTVIFNKSFSITLTGLLKNASTTITIIDNILADNNVLSSIISPNDIVNSYIKFSNLPIDSKPEATNLFPDNLKGELAFTLTLKNWFDEEGNFSTNFPPTNYIIKGFKIIKESTITIKKDVNLSEILATSLNATNVSTLLDFNDFPELTSFYDYKFVNATNITGSVNIQVKTNKWFNENGELEISDKIFDILAEGFLIRKATSIIKSVVDNSDTLASTVALNGIPFGETNLFSLENTTDIAPNKTNWNTSNFVADNLLGTLKFNVNVNNYFDSYGILQTVNQQNYKPLIFSLEFNNFKVITTSELVQERQPENILPTNFTVKDAKEFINTSRFPPGTEFDYRLANPINKTGKIDVVADASSWYNKLGELKNTRKAFKITITGCKTQQPTTVEQSNVDISQKTPSSIDSISKVFPLITFKNTYQTPTIDNYWSASNFVYFNSLGKLKLDISLSSYYNNDGNPITPSQPGYTIFSKSIEIIGFKKTTISSIEQIKFDNNILPTEINSENWLDFVSFDSFPSSHIIQNISFRPIDKDGTVEITTSIKNYYDYAGVLVSTSLPFKVILKGFKTQTKISNVFLPSNDYSKILASSIKTQQNILELNLVSYSGFPNEPTNPNENKNIIIQNIISNNIDGTLQFDIVSNSYYDQNGNLKKDFQETKVINGFKKIRQSILLQNYNANYNLTPKQFGDLLTSYAGNELEQNDFFKKYVNLETFPDAVIFRNFILKNINASGTVEITTTASKAYNQIGSVEENIIKSITLEGFINVLESNLVEQSTVKKDVVPSSITIDSSNLNEFFDITKFPPKAVFSDFVTTYNNRLGTIDLTLKSSQYYSIDGSLIDSKNTFSGSISGFEKITTSSFLKNKESTTIIKDQYYPSDFTNPNEIFTEFVDISLFPSNTEFNQFEITNLNSKGQILLSLKANSFYYSPESNFQLVDAEKEFEITISGFKSRTPTVITSNQQAANIFPSQLNVNNIKKYLNSTSTIEQVTNVTDMNDNKGTVTVSLKVLDFVDPEGNFDNNIITIKLSGFKTVLIIEETNTTLILSITFGIIGLLTIAGLVIWRIYYRKTHEL